MWHQSVQKNQTAFLDFKRHKFVLGPRFDSEPWPENELVPLEVKKGSLILLHGLVPHRSFENRSPNSRHAYTLHLIHAGAKYPSDNWLQRGKAMPLRGF